MDLESLRLSVDTTDAQRGLNEFDNRLKQSAGASNNAVNTINNAVRGAILAGGELGQTHVPPGWL